MKNFTIKILLEKLGRFEDRIKPYFGLIIILLCAFVIFQFLDSLAVKQDNLKLINSLDAKMVTYRTQEGLHVAKIQVMQTEKTRDFLKIKSQDTLIQLLQGEIQKNKKLLKKPGSSVTAIVTSTDFTLTTPTVVTGLGTSSPLYSSKYSSEWIDYVILASKDSVNFDLHLRNKYMVVLGFEKKVPYATVTNYNPYTETVDMKTYSVFVPPPKRLSLGIQAGYGIVGIGFGPYLGIGLNYDLINLR